MGKRLTLKEKVMKLVTEKHTATDLTEASRALEYVAKRILRVEMRPGTNVTFNKPGDGTRRLPHGSQGTVVRVNQKTVSVDFGPRGEWRVGPSLLTVGGTGAPQRKLGTTVELIPAGEM